MLRLPHTLRRYRPTDAPTVTDLLVAAFRTDPAYLALFGDQVDQGLGWLMPRLLRLRLTSGATVHVAEADDRVIGLLVTQPSTTRPGTFAYLRGGLLSGPRTVGLSTTYDLLAADREVHQLKNLVRPRAPYTEVLTLAVHPDHQGHGVGQALASRALEGDGPVVLVTTNGANLRFYERLGFRLRVQNGVLGRFTAWVMHHQG